MAKERGIGFYLGIILLVLAVINYLPFSIIKVSSQVFNLVAIGAAIYLIIKG